VQGLTPAGDSVKTIAANVRRLRLDRGLSASALARASGVGRATLAELEAGRGNPTVETLYGLASVLGVTLADLLVAAEAPAVHVVRAGEGPHVAGPVLEARLLRQAAVERARVEVYELRVLPGRKRRADPHPAGVVEQLLVHAGWLRVGPEQEPVELGPGDFVAFDGSVAHVYEALDAQPASATLVMISPS
jgi:transcriptional regulator with XRE-family HTH domain